MANAHPDPIAASRLLLPGGVWGGPATVRWAGGRNAALDPSGEETGP